MPDITMCVNKLTELCKGCYRYKATPDPYRQAYADFKPVNGVCEYHVPTQEVLDNIPEGQYCYKIKSVYKTSEELTTEVCPYLDISPDHGKQNNGICTAFGIKDWEHGTLLWDGVKECGEKNDV